MECMITTFAHGNGPYSRTVDLGIAINEKLVARGGNRLPIIVPLVYGNRQRRIMMEDFGDVIESEPDSILLDEFYGGILEKLFFKGGHYQRNLEYLLDNYPKLEEELRDYLSGELKLQRIDGSNKNVRGKDVTFEISHNPRVATGYKKSFYTTIGYFSEILEKTAQIASAGHIDFDPILLREVRVKVADKIEVDKKIHFMPEPFVFSYDPKRERWRDEIFTPPFVHPPRDNYEEIHEGMYFTATGIDGLQGLFDGVSDFGLKLYCPPFIKFDGADPRFPPSVVANPNIRYQFGRTGWSTVWISHLTETPLITPAYTRGDDPEIYFNELSVEKLGLASVFDKSQDPIEVIRRADALRTSLSKTNKQLLKTYETLDGIDYTANIIIDSLEGKDISQYRMKGPCL
jgi:hypothetical protein